jgi:hypothetical protein
LLSFPACSRELLCSNPCGRCALPHTRTCFRGGLLGRGPTGTAGSFFHLFLFLLCFLNKSNYFWIFFIIRKFIQVLLKIWTKYKLE